MKHLTKRIWKLECRSWPVFVCQLEAVQQKLDSQETDIFFLTDWQAADNQELIISLKQKFKTEQNLHGWMVILFSLSAPISPTFYHL